jgi:hypothetical protein
MSPIAGAPSSRAPLVDAVSRPAGDRARTMSTDLLGQPEG